MPPFWENVVERTNSAFFSLLNSHRYSRKIVSTLGEPYLAGHSLEEGLQTIVKNYQRGRYATFGVLGEDAKTVPQAQKHLQVYLDVIDLFRSHFPFGSHPHQQPVSLSVKPSTICLVNEDISFQVPLAQQLERIVKKAYEQNISVTVEMEDHRWTDATLDAAEKLWHKGYDNLGIVLQSRLFRTEKDIEERILGQRYYFPLEKIRVRACIGIYNEPETIATRDRKQMKEWLVQRVAELLYAGVYVEIATHDPSIIDRIRKEIIIPQRLANEGYEFQFLKGVYTGEKMGRELMNDGYVVRDYMPIEVVPGAGTAYMLQCLKANPRLL